ncbi:hypothetical protein GUITHDRAFT_48279, partial [Guillardia theta CCMP2712]
SVAFALGGFASSIVGSLFGPFSVILFTRVVRLQPSSFYAVHVVYAVWNAINDPLFGWMIDQQADRSHRRLPVLKYGGPMWSLSFMVTWYPWSSDGNSWAAVLHFAMSMMMYDGFLTYVMITKCALLADLCVDSRERLKLNWFSSWFGLVGSCIGTTAYYLWDEDNLDPFRRFCWGCSLLSAMAWYASGSMLVVPSSCSSDPSSHSPSQAMLTDVRTEGEKSRWGLQRLGGCRFGLQRWMEFARQLLQQKNFVLYVCMNWMMNFNVTLSKSFFIFLDKLLMTPLLPPPAHAAFTALVLYLPKIGVQLLTPLASRWGLHLLMWRVTISMLLSCGLALLVGISHYMTWCSLYVLQALLLTSWGFYDLIMADVIDEDAVKWRRRESVATSVHGVQSLLVKPSQSLAPVVGVFILNSFGLSKDSTPETSPPPPPLAASVAIFGLSFALPMLCSALQLVIWYHYDLKGERLARVKNSL